MKKKWQNSSFINRCVAVITTSSRKMFSTIIILMLVTISMKVQAQVPFLGSCPEYKTIASFDLNKYLGKWYEAERYFALFEFGGKCVTADYTYDNNGAVNIVNQQISALTGIRSTIEGLGNSIGRSDEAKLSVQFPSLPVNFDAPYWVLDTDYENYAVVWSCSNFKIFSTRNAWILTRTKNPTLKTMEKAYAALDRHGISRAYFIRTDQRNCPKVY